MKDRPNAIQSDADTRPAALAYLRPKRLEQRLDISPGDIRANRISEDGLQYGRVLSR
jgi:hypothetical protein